MAATSRSSVTEVPLAWRHCPWADLGARKLTTDEWRHRRSTDIQWAESKRVITAAIKLARSPATLADLIHSRKTERIQYYAGPCNLRPIIVYRPIDGISPLSRISRLLHAACCKLHVLSFIAVVHGPLTDVNVAAREPQDVQRRQHRLLQTMEAGNSEVSSYVSAS